MSRRIYVEASLETGATVRLDPDQSHYLTRVMRLKAGDALRCFNGAGREHAARLTDPNPRSCSIEIADELRTATPAPVRLHLAQAWLKGQAMDQVIQKATELGVTDIWQSPGGFDRHSVQSCCIRIGIGPGRAISGEARIMPGALAVDGC